MQPLRNFDLQTFNTLALPARAQFFYAADSTQALREALRWAQCDKLQSTVIGGGSNIVLPRVVEGLVLQPRLKGIHRLRQENDDVIIRIAAGEVWHDAVQYCLSQGWYGLENLALVPGHCGAAPVQNIGAYGVEISQRLSAVEVINRDSLAMRTVSAEDCQFGYRDSIFKHHHASRDIITALYLRLSTRAQVQAHYQSLALELECQGIHRPTPQDVFRAVCAVRRRRLPDPQQLPNAGSFFHNPVVSASEQQSLRRRYPDLVSFPTEGGQFKLAAGWLIERCGLKGVRLGSMGTYQHQALVLVHHGGGDGQDVLRFARWIQTCVWQQFGVKLRMEPKRL